MHTISTREFLGLERAVEDRQWRLPVTERITGGRRGSLFGGAGLAAGIVALEEATGKPVVWATGQYLGTMEPPVVLDLEVQLPAVGRSVTQARVRGHLGDQEIITIVGAAGRRREVVRGVWDRMPDAPHPDRCAPARDVLERECVHAHVDTRLARGMFGFVGSGEVSGDERAWVWTRMPEVCHDAAAVALMADYMAAAVGNAVGRMAYCTSLDNTIRFAAPMSAEPPAPGEDWVLCDTRIEFVGNGFAHGTCLMWSMQGDLLATASQSMTVLVPEADGGGQPRGRGVAAR